jgi:predicted DNA-binding transcriptional regulator YafY
MKADRLMALLLLLQSAERRTAQELAHALEVSQRTIYRDVDALCAAGIPVYTDRGASGGIALAEGYRKALTHFADEEIRALFVSNSAVLADLGLGSGLDRALDKLRGTLSDAQRRAAEKARGRIHIDQRRWNQSDAPVEKLSVLNRAVWDDRRIEIEYEDRRKAGSQRVVDPLGLVSKAGVWYLIARTDAGYRSFRADRIRSVSERAERFERPPDFDLDEHWRTSTQQLFGNQPDAYSVTIRVDPDLVDEVRGYWSSELVNADDPCTLRVKFSSRESAVRNVVMWGTSVDVIDAPDLCEAVAAHARRILERYEPQHA